jgi:HPt (histidine-containing phosphotransfer) domain-containing protein
MTVPVGHNEGFEPLNAKRLLSALGGDRELLLEIIELYRSEAPMMLNALRFEAVGGSPPAIARAAHVLKGCVANFGVTPLYEVTREIERRARAADLSTLNELMSRLEYAQAAFMQGLVRIRDEVSP